MAWTSSLAPSPETAEAGMAWTSSLAPYPETAEAELDWTVAPSFRGILAEFFFPERRGISNKNNKACSKD